jgi:hypothetical protein
MALDPKKLSIVGHLDRCTVRLETDAGSVGTGFFYAATADGQPPGETTPIAALIVTNNHVLDGATRIKMVINARTVEGDETRVGIEEPLFVLSRTRHPGGLDLTSLNMGGVLKGLERQGLTFSGTYLDASVIPTPEKLSEIEPLSDVVMVGYPNGLWDAVHNKPVFRRGVTATHAAIPWNGNPEFLIDTATFGGSSGSPVFAYSTGGYSDGSNFIIGGTRLFLIGVTKAVMVSNVQGEIRMVEIPTQQTPVPSIGLPNNLGVCIQVEALQTLVAEAIKPKPVIPGWAGRLG